MDGRLYRKLTLLALLGGTTWGLMWSVLAPYLRSLGYTGTEYGAMGGSAVLTGALFTMLGGVLSDRYGARRVVAAGLLASATAITLIATGSKVLATAGFLLNGVAQGLSFTSQQALIARSERDEKLHYAFSYVAAARTLGGAVGSFLGWAPVLASRSLGIPLVDAYRVTLHLAALLPLAAAPVALSIPEEFTPASRGRLLSGLTGFDRRFYIVASANVLIGFGAAMSIHNIDYYFAAKYGVTSAELGSVFGGQQLVMAFLMTRMPRLADRAGSPLRVYLAVSYSSIPLLIAMTFTDNYLVASALYLVRSVLMNVANPLFNAFVMTLVPRDKRGAASALLSLSWTLPAGGGRAVGGYLLDIDLELPLRLTAALYTVSLSIIAVAFRGHLQGGASTVASRVSRVPES